MGFLMPFSYMVKWPNVLWRYINMFKFRIYGREEKLSCLDKMIIYFSSWFQWEPPMFNWDLNWPLIPRVLEYQGTDNVTQKKQPAHYEAFLSPWRSTKVTHLTAFFHEANIDAQISLFCRTIWSFVGFC